MPRDTTRDLRKMGRRNFLETLAGIGVSAGALRYMSKEALAQITGDPSDEIPILLALRHKNPEKMAQGEPPEREPIYGTMPRDEWALTRAAHNAANRIDAQLKEKGIEGVTVGVKSDTDRSDVKVVAKHQADASSIGRRRLKEELPSLITDKAGKGRAAITVEDIPVILEETNDVAQLDHTGDPTHYEEEYRPVPGGANIIVDDTNSNFPEGTTCVPAYDSSAGYGIVTCAHLFFETSNNSADDRYVEDDTDRNVWQPTADTDGDGYVEPSDEVGHCYYARYEEPYNNALTTFDGAFFSLNSGINHEYAFAVDGTNSTISYDYMGVIAWDNLANRYIDELEVQGSSTDVASGTNYTTYTSPNRTIDLDLSNPDEDAYGGDSGGPIYTIQDYDGDAAVEAYIGAPLSGGYDENSNNDEPYDRVVGTYIGEIENDFGIMV